MAGKLDIQTPQGDAFSIGLAGITKVSELKAAIAERLNTSQVRLASSGKIVKESDAIQEIEDQTSTAGSTRASDGQSADEGLDDSFFRLPANAPAWKRQVVAMGRRMYVPDAILVLLLSVHWITWLKLAVFASLLPVANRFGVGPIYLLTVIPILIFSNLGTRKEGEASAYSIFNNFRSLPGQLTADEVDRQVRTGAAA